MKTITIKSKGLSFTLPMCLEECTVEQFVKIAKLFELTEAEVVAGLSGLSLDEVMNLTYTSLDDEIFFTLFWWKDIEKINKLPVPNTIKINGRVYDVPKELREYTLGQKLEVKQIIQGIDGKDTASFYDAIIPTFSVYFEKIVNVSRKEMEFTTSKLLITDVYPIFNFFLLKLLKLSRNGIQF